MRFGWPEGHGVSITEYQLSSCRWRSGRTPALTLLQHSRTVAQGAPTAELENLCTNPAERWRQQVMLKTIA